MRVSAEMAVAEMGGEAARTANSSLGDTLDALDKAIAGTLPGDRPGLVVALAARLAQLGAGLAGGVTTDKSLARRPSEEEGERLLSLSEVAERLGVPEEHAREMGRRGLLPTVRVGKRYVRVRRSALEKWMAHQERA